MATYLQSLEIRRDNIAEELAAIVNTNSSGTSRPNAGGLPNSSGEGVNVDHAGYVANLEASLVTINAQIDIERNRSGGDMFESLEV